MIFFVFWGMTCLARTCHWSTSAKKDLDLIYKTILENHPGPKDKENPHFMDWFQGGYKESKERACCARSFADYKTVLQYYVTGFRDIHLSLKFNQKVDCYWWPGFIVGYKDDKYQVAYVKNCLARELPIGSELIAVDGLTVKEFMRSYLMPYNEFIPDL